MQVVRLLEMPLAEFEDSIRMELDDNPALESSTDPVDMAEGSDYGDAAEGGDAPDDFAEASERQDREDALEMALEGIGRDDEMPTPYGNTVYQAADNEEMVFGNTTSFYDKLKEYSDKSFNQQAVGTLYNDPDIPVYDHTGCVLLDKTLDILEKCIE